MADQNKFRFRVIDRSSVDQYLRNKITDKLRENLLNQIQENGLENVDLVSIALSNSDSTSLIKELVISNHIDNSELANQIARDIVNKIELQVDNHLKKYQKFTLNAQPIGGLSEDKQFFNLISLLKDVSVLGRKLVEMAPHFNAQRSSQSPQSPSISSSNITTTTTNDNKDLIPSSPIISISGSSDNKSIQSFKSIKNRKIYCPDDDATSEELLAALIESSSSDDFLVLSSSLDSIQVRDMILASMIYIKSHECFTLSHDIQGVVMVLRRVKFIILNILAPRNQVELITKLLTSIGRYSEMNYVFDLFRDRNQFEVLLSKGVEKTPELRIALFNYVKKNPEFYALVTLNFSMFREIAESLEASAIKRLNKITTLHGNKLTKDNNTNKTNEKIIGSSSSANIITSSSSGNFGHNQHQQKDENNLIVSTNLSSSSNSFTTTTTVTTSIESSSTTTTTAAAASMMTTQSTQSNVSPTSSSTLVCQESSKTNFKQLYSRESLNLTLVELVDASDCYAKAGCYKKSNNCQRKAKLVALQIALLQNGINILNVTKTNLTDLIVNFESFYQAYIVADGYDCHLAWRQALFKQVILNGSLKYLDEFCEKCDLSPVLVEELVLLYKQYIGNNNNNQNGDENSEIAKGMSYLISKLSQVELKCKLFTQLNFDEAKEKLIQNNAIKAHLKDLKLIQ